MAEPRVVKRYANRKLYDTERSRYVTLDQVAELIRSGEDVRVVDNASKDDLTAMTLAQIIFEEEKKKSFLPLAALREIIRSGASNMSQLASTAQERVLGIFKRDKEDDASQPEGSAAPMSAAHPVRELFERSQQTFEEWQKKVDERVRATIESLSPLAGVEKELRTLGQRLSELEKRLDEHE